MEALRIYRISEKYISFLHGCDRRVQYNKGERRPYVGIVLTVSEFRYFVPLESPKPNHAGMKNGVHIMKLDGGALGLLGFNNMLPVCPEALIPLDIDSEQDGKYAELLRRQASWINRRKADVLDHAARTYRAQVSGTNQFLCRICCDFKKLERASRRYDPNHK